MKRRDFIAATAALLVSPRVLRAQGTPRRIGCFGIFLENAPNILEAWRSGLRERGWIEGKNLFVEYRYTQPTDRYPALVAELTALRPDLVVGAGPQAAVALKSATATIPIVFVGVADPVGLGLVQSLARPGGNITGLSTFVPGDFTSKGVEILRELVPGASKVALLVNPGNPIHRLIVAEEIPAQPGIWAWLCR
jgi:putative ABC transport system substrate-binding protein